MSLAADVAPGDQGRPRLVSAHGVRWPVLLLSGWLMQVAVRLVLDSVRHIRSG